MKPIFALGLRGRLISLLLAVFALSAGLTLWYFDGQREERIRFATAALLDDTRVLAARQQSIVARADAILNGLMPEPELGPSASAEACSQALAAHLKPEVPFIQIGKVLPNGDVTCAAVPPKDRVNYFDRNWFQQALISNDMAVGDVVIGRILGKPLINLAKPMRDESGRMTGILYLSLDLAWLHREMAGADLPKDALLAVVDAKGVVAVAYPNADAWASKNAADLPLVQHILAVDGTGATLEEAGLQGKDRVLAYAKLLDTVSGPMYLWLSVPKAVVEAPVRRAALFGLVIMLAVLIGAMGLVILGGNRLLLRPLLALSRAAAGIGAGDLGARTGLPHVEDEIGRLARTLDETGAAIEVRERKLARANRALRVLSAGNRAMLQTQGEQELIEAMCRAIVEAGGHRIAWVGYAENNTERSVRTVAAFGAEKDFLDALKITWHGIESGRCPLATTIRMGTPVVSNEIAAEPDCAPWRELAQRHGFASALTLPLRSDDAVIGALGICAVEPGAFDEDVVKLLAELADDLTFGIVTQRKEVELGHTRAALQTAEERFRAAAEASLDALFILKSVRGEGGDILDFEFTDINARAEQLLGMAREQVVGQKLCKLIPINRSPGFFDKYVAVLITGTPLEEEFAIDTPQIKAKWLRHQVVRVGDGIAISSRDITVWKEASRALKESEERFQIATASARDGFIILDAEGGIITWWNPAAEVIFGYRGDEIMGRPLHDFLTPARYREAARRGLAHFTVSGEGAAVGKTLELVALKKSGEEFPIELSLSAMHLHGKWFGVGVLRDISERKQAERTIVRANRALRTLSAGNSALVRAKEELELLGMVCRAIVEDGGYRMAWVGYADDNPQGTITPKAWTGVEDTYISSLNLTWADAERGQGPMSRAIRSGEPQVTHDIRSDPGFEPWREQAIAHGYASVFACPLRVGNRVIGSLGIYAAEADAFVADERDLLEELANDLAYGIETLRTRAERDRIAYAHAHHAEILRQSLEQSIQAIADTVEARDPYTAGHQRRVGELAVAIARELALPEEKIHGIRLAAAVHDLGKIHVPAEFLSMPGKLADIEFMLMKTHPQAGYDILKDVDFPWPIADIVRQHHERLDGSGYPQGLKNGDILLESRIMAVADVVEAMASHRPYRAALGLDVALKEIERGRGSAYDPAVADACLKLFRKGRFAFRG